MKLRVTSTESGIRAAILASLILFACSGGSDAPVDPVVPVVPTVATVAIAASRLNLFEGDSVDLQATVRDGSGNILTGRAVSWSTSNASIATTNSVGRVNAIRTGTATVTATVEGKSGTAAITVSNIPVATVLVSAAAGNVFNGDTTLVTATVRDSLGRPLTGRSVTWSVSDATRASVSSAGTFRGIAPGAVNVIATSEGKTGSASIVVVQRVVATVTVAATATSLMVDATTQLTATVRDVNGAVLAGQSVTWEVSDATRGSISSTGMITALLPAAPVAGDRTRDHWRRCDHDQCSDNRGDAQWHYRALLRLRR